MDDDDDGVHGGDDAYNMGTVTSIRVNESCGDAGSAHAWLLAETMLQKS